MPACPECKTPLRLPRIGPRPLSLPCPDCQTPLHIARRGEDLLVARESDIDPNRGVPTSRGPGLGRRPPPDWSKRAGSQITRALRDPLILTWLAAGIAGCLLAFAFYQASREPSDLVRAGQMPQHDAQGEDSDPVFGEDPNDDAQPPGATGDRNVAVPAPVDNAILPVVAKVPPGTAPEPVAAPRPSVPEHVDFRSAANRGLAQRVLRYEQSQPAAFETLRFELSELIGAPIRYADGIAPLEKSVSFTFSDTTAGDVLTEAARQVGLEYRVDDRGILLIPIAAAGNDLGESPANSTSPRDQ